MVWVVIKRSEALWIKCWISGRCWYVVWVSAIAVFWVDFGGRNVDLVVIVVVVVLICLFVSLFAVVVEWEVGGLRVGGWMMMVGWILLACSRKFWTFCLCFVEFLFLGKIRKRLTHSCRFVLWLIEIYWMMDYCQGSKLKWLRLSDWNLIGWWPLISILLHTRPPIVIKNSPQWRGDGI